MHAGDRGQCAVEEQRALVAPGSLFLEPFELREQHRPLPLGHPVVPSEREVGVEPFSGASAAVAVRRCARSYLGVGGDDRTALPAGHQLRRLERVGAGRTERADHLPVEQRPVRMGAVLDEHEVTTGTDLGEPFHVGRMAGDVDGDDGSGAFGDRGLDGVGIDASRAEFHVDQDRTRVHHEHRRCGGDERPARHDHLVALADAGGEQRHLDRMRAVGDGHCGPRAVQLAPGMLELVDPGSLRRPPPAAVEHVEQQLTLAIVVLGPCRVLHRADGRSTVDREFAHPVMIAPGDGSCSTTRGAGGVLGRASRGRRAVRRRHRRALGIRREAWRCRRVGT